MTTNKYKDFVEEIWPLYDPMVNESIIFKDSPIAPKHLDNYELIGAETEDNKILLYALSGRNISSQGYPFRTLSPVKAENIEEIFKINSNEEEVKNFKGHLEKIPQYTIQEVDGITGVTVKLKTGALATLTSDGKTITD